MLYRLRRAGVLLVIVIAVLAFSNVRRTPAALWSMYAAAWGRGAVVLQEWRTERAGEGALAAKVQAMLALLRDNRVETFRYSAGIASDPDPSVVQRIAEAAYPIRFGPDARDLLQLASEPLDPRCTELARNQEVLLARCT